MDILKNYIIKFTDSYIENDTVFYNILVTDPNGKKSTINSRFSTLNELHELLKD